MNWTLAEALVTLRHEVDALFPGRSKVSDGTLGDTAHAARKSDHNPDSGGVVRAWDCTRDVVDGVDVAEFLAEWLRATRDPRVKYVIFRRRIFSSSIDAWQWRPYDGLNAHEHHCHISVMPAPKGDDGHPWGIALPIKPTHQEDIVDATQEDRIAKKARDGVLKALGLDVDDPRILTTWREDGSKGDQQRITVAAALAGDRGGSLHASAVADQLAGRLVSLEQGLNTLTELVRSLAPSPPPPPAP